MSKQADRKQEKRLALSVIENTPLHVQLVQQFLLCAVEAMDELLGQDFIIEFSTIRIPFQAEQGSVDHIDQHAALHDAADLLLKFLEVDIRGKVFQTAGQYQRPGFRVPMHIHAAPPRAR